MGPDSVSPATVASNKVPKLSDTEIRKLRRQYITKGPFDTVIACGHKFHPTLPPSQANCAACWEAFFNVHPGMIAAAQSIVTAFGFEQLVKCNGKKFCKHYRAFVDKRNQEAENAKHDTITTAPLAVVTG